METLEYDPWKQQTPPENPDSDYSLEKCKACFKWDDINNLVPLGVTWRTISYKELVCEECQKLIKEELNH